MADRDRQLNKNLDTLFGRVTRGECRVCKNPVEDRRRHYCSDKCRRIAYAVAGEYQWATIRRRVIRRDDHRCLACGREPPEVTLHVDHIHPISEDGAALDPNNLQTLCEECNLKKGVGDTDHRDSTREWTPTEAIARDQGRAVSAAIEATGPIEDSTPMGIRVLDLDRFVPDIRPPDPVEPDPPEDLPEYLLDPVHRQGREALESLHDYVRDRILYLDRKAAQAIDPEDIEAGEGEELGEAVETGSMTLQTKRVPCGPGCNGCPHGPYVYGYYRTDEGRLTSKYLGKGHASELVDPETS